MVLHSQGLIEINMIILKFKSGSRCVSSAPSNRRARCIVRIADLRCCPNVVFLFTSGKAVCAKEGSCRILAAGASGKWASRVTGVNDGCRGALLKSNWNAGAI
jgi:hypothetical protein